MKMWCLWCQRWLRSGKQWQRVGECIKWSQLWQLTECVINFDCKPNIAIIESFVILNAIHYNSIVLLRTLLIVSFKTNNKIMVIVVHICCRALQIPCQSPSHRLHLTSALIPCLCQCWPIDVMLWGYHAMVYHFNWQDKAMNMLWVNVV